MRCAIKDRVLIFSVMIIRVYESNIVAGGTRCSLSELCNVHTAGVFVKSTIQNVTTTFLIS